MKLVLTTEMVEFNRLYKETDNIYTRYAASKGISTTAMCIMYSLYINTDPCTQTQLSEEWGIPMQTINSCLKTMEKKGDIRLEFAQGNRKNKCIVLTEQGRKMTEGIIGPLVEAENRALGALDIAQRRMLMALIRKHIGLFQDFLFAKE